MRPPEKVALEQATTAVESLIEHVDAVLVLISGTDDDGNTFYVRECRGNMHAVEGLIREYLRKLEGYEAGYHMEHGRQDAEED